MALPHPYLLPKEKEPDRTRSISACHLQWNVALEKMWVMISPKGEGEEIVLLENAKHPVITSA